MIWTFHHIGIGTTSFDEAIACYQGLGYTLLTRVDDDGLSVRIAFLRYEGHPLLEIVAPLGTDHPLKSMIRRKQLPSPYHIAYAVDALEPAIVALRDRGFLPLGRPSPAKALQGARIVYLYGRTTGLLELVEAPPAL